MGPSYTCGVTVTNDMYCWGYNSNGTFGNGATSTTPMLTPSLVSGAHQWLKVSAGTQHVCGVKTNNTVFCWGQNTNGRLGDGTTVQKLVPTAINIANTFTEIALGDTSSCAIATSGVAFCWGAGGLGQMGNGTITATNINPVQVISISGLKKITAGENTICALDLAGVVYCWGGGTGGEIGNGSDTDINEPSAINSSEEFTTIASNSMSGTMCGITVNKDAFCWGRNDNGQLANGTTTGTNSPIQVGAGYTWEHIISGHFSTNAIYSE